MKLEMKCSMMDCIASKISAKWVPYCTCTDAIHQSTNARTLAKSSSLSSGRHRIAIEHIATSVDAKYLDKLNRGATRSY